MKLKITLKNYIKMVWTRCAHVNRMNTKKKKILQMKPRGKRQRGRPRTRWLDHIKEDIEDRGQTWTEIHTVNSRFNGPLFKGLRI